MQKLMFVGLVLLAGATGGCIVARHGNHHHVYGPAVVIGAGHIHSDHCGHFQHRGAWYHSHGHRHGPGCGHHFRGGFWVVVD